MINFNAKTALFSLGLFLFVVPTYAKSIALSFDDGLNPAVNVQATQINTNILEQLKKHNIQSIIFPSLIKIGDYQGKELIRSWGLAGHIIANHSADHFNLNKTDVTVQNYIKSIQIADTVLKDLPNYQLIYRFPFLKEGNTAEKRDQVKHWLHEHNYQVGAVSIDASDWFYNRKYLDYTKQADKEKLSRLKQAYIQHLLDRAEYYDQLALTSMQRSPKHILLLHTNAINGAYLEDVILAFQTHGWDIISAEHAFQDPLYLQLSQNIPAGESIIWSIAKSQGNPTLRYPAEDAPYEMDNLKRFDLD